MKICVTAAEGDLDARVHWEFGKSKYFVIVDPDTMTFEAEACKRRDFNA